MNSFWKIVLAVTCVALVGNAVLLYRKNNLIAGIQPGEKKYMHNITYRVPFDYAKECIRAYRQKTGDSVINFFTISRQDFLQTIQIDTSVAPIQSVYNFVRGYIGYDTAAKKMHIFFTPVAGASADSLGNVIDPGKDVYLSGRYKTIDRQSGMKIQRNQGDTDEDGDYLLDLNAPCPTTCNIGGNSIFLKKNE